MDVRSPLRPSIFPMHRLRLRGAAYAPWAVSPVCCRDKRVWQDFLLIPKPNA